MLAAYYTGQKSFAVEETVPRPPAAGEVQLDVAYCGICGTDLHVYLGHMDPRVGNHRVIGHEMSGTVTAVGEGVSAFSPGDRVVVRPLSACGRCPACAAGLDHICHNLKFLGLDSDGAMQESWTVPAAVLHRLPDGLSMRDAALVEPVAVACHDVERGRVKPGEDVLVIGFGPIGMLIALVARHAGAKVTVAEVNPYRLDIARKLGLLAVDPRDPQTEKALAEANGGKGIDVVFEVSGTQPGVALMTAVAAARARIVMVAIHASKPSVDLFRFFWRELELIGARVYRPEDFDHALTLLADGIIPADLMITDILPLHDITSAFARLDGNATAMKTLIACNGE